MREERARVRAGTIASVACVAAVVLTLAVLQYRWNQEASDAAGLRLADSLQLSMVNWHLDLFRNLSELALTLRVTSRDEARLEDYGARLAEWRALARYPDLVAGAFIIRRGTGGAPDILRLDAAGLASEPSGGPAAVTRAVQYLDTLTAPETSPTGERGQLTESFYNIGSALRDWWFDPGAASLIRVITPGDTWLVLDLDLNVLRHRILPDLAHRYFQGTHGLDYDVAVVAGSTNRLVIYSSEPGFGAQDVADADGRMDVFGRDANGLGGTIDVFHRTSTAPGPTAAVGIAWFPIVGNTPPEEDWNLIVRHRRGGPLGAFVAQTRQRGLLISFVALSGLVLSLWMLILATTRAQRLAQLQMDFVTTVSHELRTPLAIIGSAAENIASGVVETPERLREYGEVIGHEVTQLSGLVERILRFAAIREGRQTYVLEPIAPAELIDAVLDSTAGLAQAATFTVERDVAPDLPHLNGDRVALGQCLENLVTNALKYGRDGRWLRVSAGAVPATDGGGAAVRITVTDRGPGLPPDEVARIFEPFYRTRDAHAAQIHGTGLGLALARQIAEDMGGSLVVESTVGRGASFVLTLPAVAASQSMEMPRHRAYPPSGATPTAAMGRPPLLR
ncbi:MAG: sensor histidine kinase [Vicinamibacterales bacterium]